MAINQGETISLAGYDVSLTGDLKKLEEAANMFKNNPSALAKDGPLTKLLENGKSGQIETLGTARGAAYEIETAYDLSRTGEEVIGFGGKLPLIDSKTGAVIKRLEIDIETSTKLIECKNWDWSRASAERLQKMVESIKYRSPELQQIALSRGKIFELHSKHPVPTDLNLWLKNRGITVFEG